MQEFVIPLHNGGAYVARLHTPRSLTGIIRSQDGTDTPDVENVNESVLLRRIELVCGNASLPRDLIAPEPRTAYVALHHFRSGKRSVLTVFLDLHGDEERPYAVANGTPPIMARGRLSLSEVLTAIWGFQTSMIAERARQQTRDPDRL